MRIRPTADNTQESDSQVKGPGTRGSRARDHAAARQKARHAERDYFGRVIEEPSPYDGMSEGQIQRAQEGSTRLDAWLVAQGYASSREKAKALINSGRVLVNGSTTKVKPSTPILDGMHVEILHENQEGS